MSQQLDLELQLDVVAAPGAGDAQGALRVDVLDGVVVAFPADAHACVALRAAGAEEGTLGGCRPISEAEHAPHLSVKQLVEPQRLGFPGKRTGGVKRGRARSACARRHPERWLCV